MTAYQVLHAWLETQIGSAKNFRPKGYEMPGEGTSAWADTRARAAALVEGLPMYCLCRERLQGYMTGGLKDIADVELVLMALEPLEDWLKLNPFYPSTPEDVESGRTPVTWWSCQEVAEYLGFKPQTVRNMVHQGVFISVISYRRSLKIKSSEVISYRKNKKGVVFENECA